MAKLRRESSLPRIEVDRPRPLIRTASDPICYGSTNFPSVQGVVLQNENYLESPNDKSQKLLTNTKKVRGLRSFLWIKSSANSAQASFVSQLVPCLVANLGCLSTGLALGYYTVFLSWAVKDEVVGHLPPASNNSSPPNFPLPDLGSWIGSVFWLGVLLGLPLSHHLACRLGNRFSLLLLCLPDLLGWLLLAAPPSPPLLFLGRLLTGMASGGYFPLVRCLTWEVSQEHHRSLLSLLPLPAMGLGTLIIYNLGLLLHPGHIAAVCVAIPLLLGFLLLFVRDTPLWLLREGRDHQALGALERLRGGDTGTAVAELVGLQREVKNEEPPPDFIEGVRTIYRKHLDTFATIGAFVFVMAFSGKFSVDFFAIQLFHMAGSHPNDHYSAVIAAFIYVIGCILFILLERSFSRKSLYLFSSLACGIALSTFALSIYNSHTYPTTSTMLPLLSLCLFMVCTPLGLTSLPLTLLHSSFPPELQGLASGLSLGVAALHLLTASHLYATLQAALGLHWVVWVQAALCFLAALLGLHLLPDEAPAKPRLPAIDKFAGLRIQNRRDRIQAWTTGPCTGVTAI